MPLADEPNPNKTALTAVVGTWLFAVVSIALVLALPAVRRSGPHAWELSPMALGTISLGSLFVALLAMIPNLFQPSRRESAREQPFPMPQDKPPETDPTPADASQPLATHDRGYEMRWAASFLFGLLIRITGTVALFLFSSYHSLATPTLLALWILAWHLVLLAAEVTALANTVPVAASNRHANVEA
ncbi:MAG: hypothetical protein AAGD07_07435 [Planctomycetota bacterium]